MVSASSIATASSIAFVYHLCRPIKLPLLSHSLGRFGISQLLRFAALLGIYIFSITLYAIISSSWLHWRKTSGIGASRFHALFKINIVWQCEISLYFHSRVLSERVLSYHSYPLLLDFCSTRRSVFCVASMVTRFSADTVSFPMAGY